MRERAAKSLPGNPTVIGINMFDLNAVKNLDGKVKLLTEKYNVPKY